MAHGATRFAWCSLLRSVREANRISLRALAKQVGVDVATLSRWERGIVKPDDVNARRLERALGMSADALLAEGEHEVAAVVLR